MSNKRTAAARRKTARARRIESTERAHVQWEDNDYGFVVDRLKSGKRRISWTLEEFAYIDLMALHQLRLELDGLEISLVAQLRAEGSSWAEIGPAVQVSGEALRKRLGTAVETLLEEEGQ